MNKRIKTTAVKCDLCGADNYQLVAQSYDYEFWTTRKSFNVARCKKCNHVYLNPRPISSEIEKIYPEEYTAHQFTKSKKLAVRVRRWRERKKIVKAYFPYICSKKANILDFGCGDGSLIREMLKLAPRDWRVVGMDIDQKAVNIAKANNLPVYNLKEYNELLKKEKLLFDLVIANQVIEHVESPKKMVRDIHRYLRPKGTIILETPNFDCLGRKIFADAWDEYHIPRHWHLFRPTTIKKLLRENGYTDIRITFLLSPNIWVKSIKNYLFKRFDFPYEMIHKYNPCLLAAFSLVDFFQIKISGRTSKMRVAAKRN